MSKSIANIEVDEDKFNSTNETPNLHLPQFIATDKPGWLTDFNGSMEVIDEAAKVLQDQVTEQFEDLESVHTQLDRVDDEINNPETGLKQVLSDTQTRVTDLETTVGDENHGLVKDVNVLKSDMIETNTMAVDSHAKVASLINLICAKYSTAVQYNEGAYVYTENEDGSLNFLRCTDTTRGAFNPAKWEDVTEKLITALDNSGGGSGSQYVLPIAGDADDPDAVLGGVIIGEGLSIDENGVLSRTVEPSEGIGPDYYATALRAGLVKPSDGLQVGLNGALSVVVDDSTIKIENGQLVATPDTSRFAAGQGIDITNESTPSISCKVDGTTIGFTSDGKLKAIFPASSYELTAGLGISIEVDPEAQTPTKVVSSDLATPNNFGAVMPKSPDFVFESYDQQHPERKKLAVQLVQNGGLVKRGSGEGNASGLAVNVDNETVTINSRGQLVAQGGGGGGTPYVLPPATQSTLGGIKVGSGLSVEEDGTLSATGGGSGTSLFDSIGTGLRVRNEETVVITAVPSLETGETYGYTLPDEEEFLVYNIGDEIPPEFYDPSYGYFKGLEDADPSDRSAWTPVTVTAETTAVDRILEANVNREDFTFVGGALTLNAQNSKIINGLKALTAGPCNLYIGNGPVNAFGTLPASFGMRSYTQGKVYYGYKKVGNEPNNLLRIDTDRLYVCKNTRATNQTVSPTDFKVIAVDEKDVSDIFNEFYAGNKINTLNIAQKVGTDIELTGNGYIQNNYSKKLIPTYELLRTGALPSSMLNANPIATVTMGTDGSATPGTSRIEIPDGYKGRDLILFYPLSIMFRTGAGSRSWDNNIITIKYYVEGIQKFVDDVVSEGNEYQYPLPIAQKVLNVRYNVFDSESALVKVPIHEYLFSNVDAMQDPSGQGGGVGYVMGVAHIPACYFDYIDIYAVIDRYKPAYSSEATAETFRYFSAANNDKGGNVYPSGSSPDFIMVGDAYLYAASVD